MQYEEEIIEREVPQLSTVQKYVEVPQIQERIKHVNVDVIEEEIIEVPKVLLSKYFYQRRRRKTNFDGTSFTHFLISFTRWRSASGCFSAR